MAEGFGSSLSTCQLINSFTYSIMNEADDTKLETKTIGSLRYQRAPL